jgi:hypothetical protein
LKAIETQYAGHTFRSRLEARWAAFFDILEWHWEYEPFDLNGWIPDFQVVGKCPIIFDIKPVTTTSQYEARGFELQNWVITRPDLRTPMCAIGGTSPVTDLERERGPWVSLASPYKKGKWRPAMWVWCHPCQKVRLHAGGDMVPCGHNGTSHSMFLDLYAVKHAWGIAHGNTRWDARIAEHLDRERRRRR